MSLTTEHNSNQTLGGGHWWVIGGVFFVSGAISLVYQVLWMKELGILFGNTAQAAATTLTAFFLGLALGGWFGGRTASRVRNPLLFYGILEILIALAAFLYFFLFDLYLNLYPGIYQRLGHAPQVLLLVKFGLGIAVLLPAAFFMGGTLPVLGQHMVRARASLGRAGSALYAINTFGAALGAALAGFLLPVRLGFNQTYLLAIGANLAIGVLVVLLARRTPPPKPLDSTAPTASSSKAPPVLPAARVRMLAFLTGMVTLALEVLWTQMFSQVLHNSVYSFALILIVFLVALASGSVVAHFLGRRAGAGPSDLLVLMGVGGLLVALSPWLFNYFTDGMSYLGGGAGLAGYLLGVLGLAGLVMFLPTMLIGSVFPYLLKLSEAGSRSPGRTIGTLVSINTAAAIVGSLAAGFVLLEWFGLWPSIRILALLTLLGVPLVGGALSGRFRDVPWIPAWLVLSAAGLMASGHPALVKVDPDKSEVVLKTWQGSSGVVAVIEDPLGLRIKVNNHYGLGGSASREHERRQGQFPLLLHPAPEDVFYLGLGTGITASGGLSPAVKRMTVCELIPDAITAAETYFERYTDGLFVDSRVRVLPEDGRTFLLATDERYDAIVSDLFVPWRSGVGSLYSLEHFQAVAARLKPGGLFAQWVPLFQMSRDEFDIVVKTMLEVFPEVSLWRGDFSPTTPIVALIGRLEPSPVDASMMLQRVLNTPEPEFIIQFGESEEWQKGSLLIGYVANLSEARGLFETAAVNTDDRPIIEYQAPITHRKVTADRARWLVGMELDHFLSELEAAVPPDQDPNLRYLTENERRFVQVGRLQHHVRIMRDAGEERQAVEAQTEIARIIRNQQSD